MAIFDCKQVCDAHDMRKSSFQVCMCIFQVARILNVSDEMKGQMGVTSGLELVTLPHGRQLRQDLMER